jgi:hypothetical protein
LCRDRVMIDCAIGKGSRMFGENDFKSCSGTRNVVTGVGALDDEKLGYGLGYSSNPKKTATCERRRPYLKPQSSNVEF